MDSLAVVVVSSITSLLFVRDVGVLVDAAAAAVAFFGSVASAKNDDDNDVVVDDEDDDGIANFRRCVLGRRIFIDDFDNDADGENAVAG